MTGRGQFKPGQSGNPAGRPKTDPEVREILKAASPMAARKLVGLLDSFNDKVVFQAVQEILNRTEGKPRESVQMNLSGGLDVRAQIRDLLMERERENGQQRIEITDCQ